MNTQTKEKTSKGNGAPASYKNAKRAKGSSSPSSQSSIGEMVQESGEKMGALASDIYASTADTIETGTSYVTRHPIKGAAMAAAAGLFAGSLLTAAIRGRK